ncbi:MAG: helicase HerA-like domain-containing protein [Paracoccaceae bacterium]
MIEGSPLHGKYETPIDRRSAYEVLQARAIAAVEDAEKV